MRRLQTFFILLALGFYVWFLRRFGLGDVYRYVRLAGWGLALTISLETAARLANTMGWRVTIENCPRGLGFGQLFAARVAGEAIDYVTPSAQLGGQFMMAVMVRRELAMAVGLATVVVAALAEALGQIGFISTALVATLPREAELHHLLGPAAAGLAIALGLAAAFFVVQIKRPFSYLWKAAVKLDLPGLDGAGLKDEAAETDALLLEFYARHRLRLLASCLCYLAAWAMGPIEIYILLRLLHEPASFKIAAMVEALGLLIERATFMIPGKLVSQEGGKALIFSLLGYPPDVGFVIGFLRRIKEMVWVLFGLASLTAHRVVAERAGEVASASGAEVMEIQGAQGGEQSL